MKLELDLNPTQNKAHETLISQPEQDLIPLDLKKMLRVGIKCAKEGNRVEARQMLLGVTEAEPDNETAWLWLASISEYPEELLVFLQNVLRINPNNARALEWAKQTRTLLSKTFVQRGIDAVQKSQKEFGKQCFLQGIVHDGDNEMAWLWLASIADSQEEKVSHLNQVLRINPRNETALNSLSSIKGNQSEELLRKASSAAVAGDHETARATLDAIMAKSPDIEEAWVLKAFLTSDFYEKIECYKKALEINPECDAAQAGLASLQSLFPNKQENEVAQIKKNNQSVVEELTGQTAEQEDVEYDDNFDLEKLVTDTPSESVEEQKPESRAVAEEVYRENLEMEYSIHETQTETREDYAHPDYKEARSESVFSYSEAISQEDESVLEFDETFYNPTQELEEETAQRAETLFSASNIIEDVSEPEEQTVRELEDFYTEETSTNFAAEKSPSGPLKAEVRVTETYVTEVEQTEVYNSEFYANDGFVLVPQNDPFANQDILKASKEDVNEGQQFAGVENDFVEEAAESEPCQEINQNSETQEDVLFEETQTNERTEEVGETQAEQPEIEAESVEKAGSALDLQPEKEEGADTKIAESSAEEKLLETQQFEQSENLNEDQSVDEVEQSIESAESAEEQVVETVEETAPDEQVVGESVRAEYFEQPEQLVKENSETEQAKAKEEYADLVSEIEAIGATASLIECPFCGAENEKQVVCNSCDAMLSLADMEALISHQGVNQDILLQAIERMEVEKSVREFNAAELTSLAIAHLNAKNLEKGLGYLRDASALNPNDIVLPAKIKFLNAHLDELKDNRFRNAENPSGNKTILVVDDSPTVRKLISGKLEKCGHSVLSAVDGMDALAKINEVIPDLILLDITMPRLDGYQVCKLIRNNEMTKEVPIVMISGKDGFFDKVRGRMAGSSGYITKPFGPDTLMKTIETYLS